MALRVLNVNNLIDLKSGGGTAERTFQMSRQLARAGVECHVLTIQSDDLDCGRLDALAPASVTVLPNLLQRYHVPVAVWSRIRALVEGVDIVHLMGHWSILNALVYLAARRTGRPYVLCPAGALPLFGRSRWLKFLYNFAIGNAIVRNASGWIAVTKAELPHFEAYGVAPADVKVIPNGVDEADFPEMEPGGLHALLALPKGQRILLFMGRLNLIKGPDLLLQAFVRLRAAIQDIHLVFAGPDGGMQEALQASARAEGVEPWVHFLGHVSGEMKVAAYRDAELLVVPSRQEAMSIVAVEAGFCGTPVLLTDQCGFEEIKTIDPRLETEATVSAIASAIGELLAAPDLRAEIAPRWRAFVTSRFAWENLVPEYLSYYGSIISTRNRPASH
jgi:glycosyltransferase involved in cell wall biosynthesis